MTYVLVADDGTRQVVNLFGLDLVSQDSGADVRTLLVDGLGSVRVEMVAGVVETATTYEPYGEVLQQTGTSGTVYGFTGEQEDSATGLLYLRARYYNSSLKSFMSRDPWEGSGWRPGTLNYYVYSLGNPILFVDTSGQTPFSVPPAPPPDARVTIMENFRDVLAPSSFSGNLFTWTRSTLNAEIDFVGWMQRSRRVHKQNAGNWWDKVNGYAVASRMSAAKVALFTHILFPCFEYRDLSWYWGGPFAGEGDAGRALAFVQSSGLEPGLEQWVYLVWFMEYAKQSPHEITVYNPQLPVTIFWKAHNAAIREGVDRAVAERTREDYWEQVFINYVLYNVLYPGDQCAQGDLHMCTFYMRRPFLGVGVLVYPNNYPAKWYQVGWTDFVFSDIYKFWKIPPPYWVNETYRIQQVVRP